MQKRDQIKWPNQPSNHSRCPPPQKAHNPSLRLRKYQDPLIWHGGIPSTVWRNSSRKWCYLRTKRREELSLRNLLGAGRTIQEDRTERNQRVAERGRLQPLLAPLHSVPRAYADHDASQLALHLLRLQEDLQHDFILYTREEVQASFHPAILLWLLYES